MRTFTTVSLSWGLVAVVSTAAADTIAVSPHPAYIQTGGHVDFTATRSPTRPNGLSGLTWAQTGGRVDAGGHYIASGAVGAGRVIADVPVPGSDSIRGTWDFSVNVAWPAVSEAALTTPPAGVPNIPAGGVMSVVAPWTWQHDVATRGDRGYYGWISRWDAGGGATKRWGIFVRSVTTSSNASGQTWGAAVLVNPQLVSTELSDLALATDATDPNILYLTWVDHSVSPAGQFFSKSVDGGQHFTNPKQISGRAPESADIFSQKHDQVTVELPGWIVNSTDTASTLVDDTEGNAFALPHAGFHPLATLSDASGAALKVDFNSQTFSPRLFGDANHTCMTYEGNPPSTSKPYGIYVICSNDGGVTWPTNGKSTLVHAATGTTSDRIPVGSFGPAVTPGSKEHFVAIAFYTDDHKAYVAVSNNNGVDFNYQPAHAINDWSNNGALAYADLVDIHWDADDNLWLAYRANVVLPATRKIIVVQKSIDQGAHWSTGMNATPIGTDNMTLPALFSIGKKVGFTAQHDTSQRTIDAYTLVP